MTRSVSRALVALLALFLAAPVFAQVVDTTFFSTDRQVMAMVREGNTVYIGGWFTGVGTASGGGVPLNPATGDLLQPYPRVMGIVRAVVADGLGGWYVGGSFSSIGGLPISGLAHVLADGAVESWNPQLGPSAGGPPAVTALALSGTTLYVAGDFTQAGGALRGSLAAFEVTTGQLTPWDPEANAAVECLAVDDNQVVYAGGSFTQIGGVSRNRVAALDPATGIATAWNAQMPPYDGSIPLEVKAVAAAGATLYVGGFFDTIGGATRRGIAQLRTSDGGATSWNPDAGVPGANGVSAIAVDAGVVYAGGTFQTIGGQSRSNIAALDASGAATTWNPGSDGSIACLAARGGTVYAGGVFQNIGGAARSRLAALDAATGAATVWNPAPNSTVFALASTDIAVYAGGAFNLLRPTPRHRLAAFDATTHELLDWNPDADNQVDALVVHGGRVYIGGVFANVGGMARARLAEIDAATGIPTSWSPGADARVNALTFCGDTLFAGGSFQNAGGLSRKRVAAFDMTTGTLLTRTFDADGEAQALISAAGRVYVGGAFNSIGGVARNRWAAIDPALGVIPGWIARRSVGNVYSLAVLGSVIYAGHDNGVSAVELATGDTTDFRSTFQCGTVEAVAATRSVVYAGGGCGEVVALHAGTGSLLPWGITATNIRSMLLDGDELFITGGLSLASGNSIQSGFVRVPTLDISTPTLGDFHAVRTSEGVRLEWRVVGAVRTRVERAEGAFGPWQELALVPIVSDELVSTIDSEITGERWYRITAGLADGSTVQFGPVEVPAPSATVARSGIKGVSPNPAAGLVRIDLAAVEGERVRVSVLDIAGREVDVLHDGELELGTHTLLWEPRRAHVPLPAGVYFVLWRSGARTEQRRIVTAR